MSLSWTKSKTSIGVAITTSKTLSLSNKILYLNDDSFERKEKPTEEKKLKEITKDDISKVLYSRIQNRKTIIDEIYNALHNNVEFKSDNAKAIQAYDSLKRTQQIKNDKIELPVGSEFELLPLMKEDLKDGNYRQTLFVSGMPNSGKSYFCKQYLLLYQEMYPKNKIFFISQQQLINDESLSEVKRYMEQIPIEDLLDTENPIDWESFTAHPCLVMFDDVDGLDKKPTKRGQKSTFQIVLDLMYNILANARKFGTFCLITNHDLNPRDGSTSKILKNVDYFVVFTRGILKHNLEYFGTKYLGLSKELLSEMKQSPSRWFAIRRSAPLFMLSQYDARILE